MSILGRLESCIRFGQKKEFTLAALYDNQVSRQAPMCVIVAISKSFVSPRGYI